MRFALRLTDEFRRRKDPFLCQTKVEMSYSEVCGRGLAEIPSTRLPRPLLAIPASHLFVIPAKAGIPQYKARASRSFAMPRAQEKEGFRPSPE